MLQGQAARVRSPKHLDLPGVQHTPLQRLIRAVCWDGQGGQLWLQLCPAWGGVQVERGGGQALAAQLLQARVHPGADARKATHEPPLGRLGRRRCGELLANATYAGASRRYTGASARR